MFGCRHTNQTTPRRDEEGEYRRCIECGTRIAWAWPVDAPVIPPPTMTAPPGQSGDRGASELERVIAGKAGS